MEKIIYLVNHGEAAGYNADDGLTAEGLLHSEQLGEFLERYSASRIITSSLLRARQTANAIGEKLGIHIEEDSRLAERQMNPRLFREWLLKTEGLLAEVNFSHEDSEKTHEAMHQAYEVIDELPDNSATILVAHSLLIVMLLHHVDERISVRNWDTIEHPDVYELRMTDQGAQITHLWGEA